MFTNSIFQAHVLCNLHLAIHGEEHPSQYDAYVERYIPETKRPLLDEVLKDGPDLHKIAKYPVQWQTMLVGPLELTSGEVGSILYHHNTGISRRLANLLLVSLFFLL